MNPSYFNIFPSQEKIVSDNEKIKMIVVSKTYRFMTAIKITKNRQM